MRGNVAESEAPQFMTPIPMGRVLSTVVRRVEDAERRDCAAVRCVWSMETSVPAARKPRPPARETAVESRERAMRRIGAPIMRGDWVHG